jgi:hypothetical protein
VASPAFSCPVSSIAPITRLYTAILRHAVLVMAALAICAVTAALLEDRTDTQAPPTIPNPCLVGWCRPSTHLPTPSTCSSPLERSDSATPTPPEALRNGWHTR